jgi:hypothetical protein
MWKEGEQSMIQITKRPVTVATRFKSSMISLVENLSIKVKIELIIISVESI